MKLHDLAGLRVIASEDDTVSRLVLARQLGALGCEFHLCDDGFSLLRLVEQADADLAIIDMRLPDIDGDIVARHIRMLSGRIARLPILFVSADNPDSWPDDLIAPCLLKPLTTSELRVAMNACLHQACDP